MKTIHLVYPHGNRISCPDAIGRNLGQRLERKYRVRYYSYDENRVIKPQAGDILLGHPTYSAKTCFRQSISEDGWGRVIAMFPYHHGNEAALAFADSIVEKCDLFLAITGNYWFRSVDKSVYSHWLPKMVHLDLAVDREDFPPVKVSFNPPGSRKFVFVGNTAWTKNPSYLSAIARHMPPKTMFWIGAGRNDYMPGMVPLGYLDFASLEAKKLIGSFDFMITASDADANPATILEAMAWGLVPVCTRESGYAGFPGIVNIPANDVRSTVASLTRLQTISENRLKEQQVLNWSILDSHFNWDRFSAQVVHAVESELCPSVEKVSVWRKSRIRAAALLLPLMRFRLPHLRYEIASFCRGFKG